jgi:hypothetical protein
MSLRDSGTNARRAVDVTRIAEAIKMPGIDPRHWVSYGTVGTERDDGTFDTTDPKAVYNGPEGLEVDVLLEPLGFAVTAHYSGIHGGAKATIVAPIKAGDRVLVVLPEGELTYPVIVAVLHSNAVKVPLGDDGKPLFRNDKVFVWGQGIAIDIQNSAGAKATLKADGEVVVEPAAGKLVKLGTDTAPLQFAGLGDAIEQYLGEIKTAFNKHKHEDTKPEVGSTSGGTDTTITGVSPVKSSNVKVKV